MVESPMANPKKDLAKIIDAIENLPHHYEEYLAMGKHICKSIPFEEYFYYFRFGFKPTNVDDYSLQEHQIIHRGTKLFHFSEQ